ncbi:ABC transporter substrate-binding protein [Dongia soli]|uniref:ABC transporter substrate-binding protein n=1 Tax=Dongia soli TaxID=600628 RepID=A0ABU5EAP7_9PROT|nr:ABC transporter substrate-binding protein [Dongia soli]MDY0882936.1 ABC transporter substrate-binding protein [Dongia soli]
MTTWNDLRPSRRQFLTGAAAFGLAGSAGILKSQTARAAEGPKRGGVLRLGIGGGSTTASLDPRSYADIVTITLGAQFFSSFVEFDAEHQIQPALIESWDVKSGAAEWVLTARKGVTFHNGKTVTVDDLIYSLNLHRGNSTSGVVGQTKHIKEVKKIGDRQIGITLSRGDSELINLLGDYHFKIVPDGFADWSKPIGSGPFVFESYVPGVSAKGNRFADYWASDRAFVDTVETTVINDTPARTNALITGQVDIINRADKRTVDLLKQASNVTLETGPTGWHAIIAAKTDTAPFNNANLRLALKYAIDREEFLKTLLNGYGTVGNDHPIRPGDPFYNTELPQTLYDADKAKFYLKKADLGNVSLQLSASEAAFEGAINAAELYQASAAKAGLNIAIQREPVDGFWSNVWLKRPFTQSYWQGRSTALQMLAAPYKSDSPWNETAWRNASFDKLLTDAAVEIDTAKRKSYVWEAQRLLHEEGGAIIPIFQDELEAHGNQVKGYRVGGIDSLFNGRIAEYVWLDS